MYQRGTKHETHRTWMSHLISELILRTLSISELREFRFREAKQSEKGHTANWWQSYKLDPSLVLKGEGFGAGRCLRFESFTSWFVIM